jgi:hypothetical protein
MNALHIITKPCARLESHHPACCAIVELSLSARADLLPLRLQHHLPNLGFFGFFPVGWGARGVVPLALLLGPGARIFS